MKVFISFRFFPSKKNSATFSLSGDVCRCRRQGWYPGTSRHRGGEVPCSSAGIDDHLHRTGPMMSVGNGRLRMNAKYRYKINYHTRHLRCEVHLSMKNICVETGDHESLLSQHLKQITHQNLFPPSFRWKLCIALMRSWWSWMHTLNLLREKRSRWLRRKSRSLNGIPGYPTVVGQCCSRNHRTGQESLQFWAIDQEGNFEVIYCFLLSGMNQETYKKRLR